ncbi:MAG: inositol monophosphatase [Lachnospiraceae bacterium]|nr:inositol monophosphatase [Lachnospiraceae bacterium]
MDLKQVKDIILEAGNFLKNREAAAHITVKGAADYVTETDKQVQDFIQKSLEKLYPEIQFLGEEKNNDEVDISGKAWVLDPVDGTTNLIHDYKRSSISLALANGGKIAAGIVYQPYTEELFYAERGKGAYLNGKRIYVSSAKTMEECLVSVGTDPYNKKELGEQVFRDIYRVFMDCQDIRRSGSAAIDLAETAAGRLDGFFEAKLNIWDYAAGQLLVEEAGGKVTDYAGNALECAMNSSVVCGNPAIHALLVEKYLR